jgi:hypothetical protein
MLRLIIRSASPRRPSRLPTKAASGPKVSRAHRMTAAGECKEYAQGAGKTGFRGGAASG